MNNSTQLAQETTGKVTAAALLKCIKSGGDKLFLHGDAPPGRPSYSDAFIFKVTSVRKHTNGTETRTQVDVPGYVSNGHTSVRVEVQAGFGLPHQRYDGVYRPSSGFWMLWNNHLKSILELLPRNAEVAFYVYLDAGTNELCVRADIAGPHAEKGLHGDHLYLKAQWNERGKIVEREFLIDTCIVAHNAGRFGYGR